MNIEFTSLLQAIIALAAVVITTFVIPYIKRQVSAEDLREFHAWVKIAVAAAEQVYAVTDGAEKKQYVLDYLTRKGFDVDIYDLENSIEAAVLELHNALYGGSEDVKQP